MGYAKNKARELLARDLALQIKSDSSIESVGAWIEVDGVDIFVSATTEEGLEGAGVVDETAKAAEVDENQLELYPT